MRKWCNTFQRISIGRSSVMRSSGTLSLATISPPSPLLFPRHLRWALIRTPGEASTVAIPPGYFSRRYLLKEFPELIVFDGSTSIHVLEVGCGNGSTALPILRANQNIIVYACDCSQDVLDKAGEMVATSNIPSIRHRFYPFLHDFSSNRFPDWLLACQKCSVKKKIIFTPDANGEGLIRLNEPSFLEAKCCIGGIDYVTLIFTLSAILFQRMPFVIAECMAVLKPGGLLLFRDYGLFDMTMLRFPPEQRVGFREYMRSDGTLSYFFSLDIVRNLFFGAGFAELELEYCCVISVNRRSGKKMQRVWIHGKFQKPVVGTS